MCWQNRLRLCCFGSGFCGVRSWKMSLCWSVLILSERVVEPKYSSVSEKQPYNPVHSDSSDISGSSQKEVISQCS